MPFLNALLPPTTDPTPLFEVFRGAYATQLLTAAVAHLGLFEKLETGAVSEDELQVAVGLARRPFVVLTTALKAMGLLVPGSPSNSGKQTVNLSPLASEHLLGSSYFDVSGYVGLAAQSPDVLEMVARLRSNQPAGTDAVEAGKPETGAAFIFGEGIESAMEREASARWLTMALAGRAKNVAPVLAQNLPLENAQSLVDVGGGTGIYSIALLQRHPHLRATVLDGAEVLKVAAEMAGAYGVADRLKCQAGDMFQDEIPSADLILLSNILHDWDEPQCQQLVSRCAAALKPGGRLVIHDVFLNDALDGPLPIALYSAALFTLTEGRAYSGAEYRQWLQQANLVPQPLISTLVHCGLLIGKK